MGVLKCKPRDEVLRGDLNDAMFAADFGDVITGAKKTPAVYANARQFFENTYPTAALQKVVQAVFERLADKKEGGALVRLSTGFGGGKSHTLMAMWHLARHIRDHTLGTDVLPAAGRPDSVTVAAVDARRAGSDVFGSHGRIKTRSLWGDLALQLGKNKGYKAIAGVDSPEKQPSQDQVDGMFPAGPLLLLLDELVIYMATLDDRGQGNLLAFLGKLLSAVAKRPQTAIVITDTAGQMVYAAEAERIQNVEKTLKASHKLGDILGRTMANFDPIGDEAAQVIVRRLFKSVDRGLAESASAEYHSLYQRVARESQGALPPDATTPDYAQRIVRSYPFHPRLLDTAQNRLGALPEFNKSRGTLRLFARIIRDIWDARVDLPLITAGDIDWTSSRIQADLLHRLNRDQFAAAVNADVVRHAQELDGGPRGIHRRVASALLFESLPMESNSGLDRQELTLAVLRPDEAGPEPADALDRLVRICWHTYPMAGGRGVQFRYQPNVNRLIEEGAEDVPIPVARQRVIAEVLQYFSGPLFDLVSFPESARQVPSVAKLQLVLCESDDLARRVCALEDDADPAAPMPRAFRNAILAVAPTPSALDQAVYRARRLLAADELANKYKRGEQSKLVREGLAEARPHLQKHFAFQACRAFDRVVLADDRVFSLTEEYLVSEEDALKRTDGQKRLMQFLRDSDLVFESTDAVDVRLFLKQILPGTVPLTDLPGAYTAKAIHERFLAVQDLRLIPDSHVVRNTLLLALKEGKVVIRTPDGAAYDANGCVAGPKGARRRDKRSLTDLRLEDDVLVALAGSAPAAEWLTEDKYEPPPVPPSPPPPPPTPPDGPVTATAWDAIVKYAAERPLIDLELTAGTPALADSLAGLVQPLNANAIEFTIVRVEGDLKDGGEVQFQAERVRLNHPANPLKLAKTISNALEEGYDYETRILLTFEGGRPGMQDALRKLAHAAPAELRVKARFDAPPEKAQ